MQSIVSVHTFLNAKRLDHFIFQTETEIKYFDRIKIKTVSAKDEMQAISIQRGLNDIFYFVESEKAKASTVIYQFKYKEEKKNIYELNNGEVLALEIDAKFMVENQDFKIDSDGKYQEN